MLSDTILIDFSAKKASYAIAIPTSNNKIARIVLNCELSTFSPSFCPTCTPKIEPKISRGLHPSGYTDNLVHNINDLAKLNPKTDGVRIGHSVGTKKRKEIVIKSIEKKFKIFNARVTERASKS